MLATFASRLVHALSSTLPLSVGDRVMSLSSVAADLNKISTAVGRQPFLQASGVAHCWWGWTIPAFPYYFL